MSLHKQQLSEPAFKNKSIPTFINDKTTLLGNDPNTRNQKLASLAAAILSHAIAKYNSKDRAGLGWAGLGLTRLD